MVALSKVVESVLEENVFRGNIAVDEAELCVVLRVREGVLKYLKHGSNACATSDHADTFCHVSLVLDLRKRPLDLDLVSDVQPEKMTGHHPIWVPLHHEVKVALGEVGCRWGVRANSLSATLLRLDVDARGNRETHDIFRCGKLHAEQSSVVAQRDDRHHWILSEHIRAERPLGDPGAHVALGWIKETSSGITASPDPQSQSRRPKSAPKCSTENTRCTGHASE
mmetsp:Transcript_31647/g.91965  ORF Transcript_31647/g.91965 Transcript_31647/m.91965 type:complete len:224 (-) Transcript_31647:94-765(-)